MKKNRKISNRRSAFSVGVIRVGSIVFVAFIAVILNLLGRSSGDQLMKTIGEKERMLGKLTQEHERTLAAWQQMTTAQSLEAQLSRFGISMHYTRPSQRVRMTAQGDVKPGQTSVAKIIEHFSSYHTAQANTSSRGKNR